MGKRKYEPWRERYVPEPNSGCWLYTGRLNNDGYGIIDEGREFARPIGAHRAFYEEHVGKIQDGMVVMHACDNPACVNPDHLRAGTQLDNIADRHAKGRTSRASRNAGQDNGNWRHGRGMKKRAASAV